MPRRRCPHARIEHCPLYVESHNPRQLGCVDGKAWEGPDGRCMVDRGASYARMVGKLTAVDPHLVAACKWRESTVVVMEQRERNLRVNGLH